MLPLYGIPFSPVYRSPQPPSLPSVVPLSPPHSRLSFPSVPLSPICRSPQPPSLPSVVPLSPPHSRLSFPSAPLTPDQLLIARVVYDKWSTYRFNSLKNELLSAAVLLKEANAISVELQKQVTYQFTILTDTPYSPLPLPVVMGTDIDVNSEEFMDFALDNITSPSVRPRGPIVAVEVRDSKHGATQLWSMNKLRYPKPLLSGSTNTHM